MYSSILILHSLVRWLVLTSLIGAIILAFAGLRRQRLFTPFVNTWRHWTATTAHVQLLLGMSLYFQSPVVRYAMPPDPYHVVDEHVYFRYLHITLMFVAVISLVMGMASFGLGSHVFGAISCAIAAVSFVGSLACFVIDGKRLAAAEEALPFPSMLRNPSAPTG